MELYEAINSRRTVRDFENEPIVVEYLGTFQKLIERMTAKDIIEGTLTKWLSQADENDPVKCGFPKCKKYDAYICVHGCQVCTD